MHVYGKEAPWWGEYAAQYREAQRWIRGQSVLDVGCGRGFGSRELFDNGAVSVHGVDVDQQAILYAKSLYSRDGVTFDSQDICEGSNSWGKFDLVTCFQVLERVASPNLMIQNIAKALRPKGTLILSTVNRTRYSHLHEAPCDPSHFVEFDQEELVLFLKPWFPVIEIMSLACTKEGGSLVWENKLIEKIPFSLKDAVYQRVMGESYFPTEADYVLRPALTAERLFYAVCRKA